MIGSNTVSNNKVVKPSINTGKCKPCLSRYDCQCCKQVIKPRTFSSQITKKTYDIRHNLDSKSKVICPLDCQKCDTRYVGKSETPFNIRLNNHRKDVNNTEATLSVSKHFREANHSFNRDAKFTLIEKINNHNISQKDMRRTLENHEDLWIIKLRTLKPNGFNDKLSHPESTIGSFTRATRSIILFLLLFYFILLLCRLYCGLCLSIFWSRARSLTSH